MHDVCDGKAYAHLLAPGGFLRIPTNITLTMNTDGAQVFHSSSRTMWPVLFVINELPPTLRYSLKMHLPLRDILCIP